MWLRNVGHGLHRLQVPSHAHCWGHVCANVHCTCRDSLVHTRLKHLIPTESTFCYLGIFNLTDSYIEKAKFVVKVILFIFHHIPARFINCRSSAPIVWLHGPKWGFSWLVDGNVGLEGILLGVLSSSVTPVVDPSLVPPSDNGSARVIVDGL